MFVWESFTFTFFYLSKVKNTALDINAHYFHFSMIVCVPQVKNDIASAIFRRVIKVFKAFVNVHTHTHNSLAHSSFYEQNFQAHKSGETFRVFILMPLLPAFEGDVSGDSGTGREKLLRPNM